jgi:hypothetical protein
MAISGNWLTWSRAQSNTPEVVRCPLTIRSRAQCAAWSHMPRAMSTRPPCPRSGRRAASIDAANFSIPSRRPSGLVEAKPSNRPFAVCGPMKYILSGVLLIRLLVAPHFAEVVIHFVTDLRNNPDVMLTARRLIA